MQSLNREVLLRSRGRIAVALAIAFVLWAYAFFASAGYLEFRRGGWKSSYYASQAEGFLRGQLNMADEADPALVKMENPYDHALRDAQGIPYMWDVSYFRGKYYLYFTPVPIVLFFIPFHQLAGGYPPESLAVTFFSAWAFLAAVAFLRRARQGRASNVPLWLWVLAIGIGHVLPYVLGRGVTYEVAVTCSMAMSATWAYATLVYRDRPTPLRAANMALWVGLTIASRPNTAALVLAGAAALAVFTPRERWKSNVAAWVIAGGTVAASLGWYNAARFGSPLEFGAEYQMNGSPLNGRSMCSVCSIPEVVRFLNMTMHHVMQPPTFAYGFPWVDLPMSRIDHITTAGSEQAGGIAAITPFVLLALGLALSKRFTRAEASWRIPLAASWVVLLSLSTCWFIAARYSLDYTVLMVASSAAAIESFLDGREEGSFLKRRIRTAAVVLAIWSIVLGLLLGFQGPGTSFRNANPEVFNRLANMLGG